MHDPIRLFQHRVLAGGYPYVALSASGYLFLCSAPQDGPGCLGCAPAGSEAASGLVRRAVVEFGYGRPRSRP
jgi:hypothetical protein